MPRQPNPQYNGRVPSFYYREVTPQLTLGTVPHSYSGRFPTYAVPVGTKWPEDFITQDGQPITVNGVELTMAELFDILTREYTKVSAILDIAEEPVWTPVASVTQIGAHPGLYELGMSVQGTLADTNDSASIRFRVNGSAWTEFRREAKDNTDTFGAVYMFPSEFDVQGDITLEMEAAKTTGGNQFDIDFADVWIYAMTDRTNP